MEKYEIDYMLTNLQSYLESRGIETNKLFRCLNPEHIDSNASMKYFNDHKVYCFGCGANYNLVDVISIMEHLDHKEAFKRAIDMYCPNRPKDERKKLENIEKEKPKEKEYANKDYQKAYSIWEKNYRNSELGKEYIKSRGIDERIAEKFKIGLNTFDFGKFKLNAIIIPISKNCFTARNINNTENIRYYKPTGCRSEFFNINALNDNKPYCVITEGEFDCLSFENAGINAMALCSVNNINKFISMQKPQKKTYILALDNDAMGKKTTNTLIEYFKGNNIDYVVFDNCGYKDANEALVKDKEKFNYQIHSLCNTIIRNYNKKLQDAEM